MAEGPHPRDNGYLWVARVALSLHQARVLARELRGFRHDLRARDVSALGDPEHDTDVELWAHPEDQRPVARILGRLVAE